ncbi:hypothetical protein R5R35_004679 [Gryllus longicercus]|uniref:Uncharacterized protein n=1 Tax=Gryllus longicercus TaxID=2509291 RepID=A0AAN9W4L2_9ORTH
MSVRLRKGGRWCSAPNCKNNSNTNKNISFFGFPKDEKRLKPDAVPTLFDVANSPKTIALKRKTPRRMTGRNYETYEVAKKSRIETMEELKPSASFFLEPMKVVKQEILEDYEEELDPPTTMHLEPEEVKEEIVEVYEEFESTSTLNIEPEETIKEEIAEGEEEFEHSATLYIEPEETVKEEIAEWDVEVKDFEYISVGACDLATTNNENEDVSDDGSLLGDWYSYAEATPNNRNCKTTPRSKNKTEKHIGSITTAIKELKDLEKSLSASPLTIRTTVIEDECEIMGKWIASQLRKLPKHSRHRANLEIQQVIKKHSVEHMNSSSSVLSASLSNDHTYSILKPFNS